MLKHALDEAAEALLVDEARRGEALALRQLVELHRHRVFRYLMGHAITSAEAEELTQDVLFEAYRSLGSFQGRSRYLSWLTGIALNRVRNYVSRTPWRTLEVPLTGEEGIDLALLSPSLAKPPEVTLAYNEAIVALFKCIDMLPKEARDGLLRVGVEEMTWEEAAACSGEPLGTLKSRISRTRKALRLTLAAGHYDALAGRP
jgi:RNA polymerase sigma-70 factor (ECF subfamily)